MKKLEETNAIIDTLRKVDLTDVKVSFALLDIAKSLAIIADSLATMANDKEVGA